MIAQKPYGVGDFVKVHHVHGGYRLPDGLRENARVRVVAFAPGVRTVEYAGRQFEVQMACIFSGWLPMPCDGV